MYGWNKLLIKKTIQFLINCVVVVVMNSKSRVYVFSKFYYESVVLLYDDQNRNKLKIWNYLIKTLILERTYNSCSSNLIVLVMWHLMVYILGIMEK